MKGKRGSLKLSVFSLLSLSLSFFFELSAEELKLSLLV